MGTGALVSTDIEPAAFKQALANPDPTLNGPTIVVVQLRKGIRRGAARSSLQRIADDGTHALQVAQMNQAVGSLVVLSAQHPAEIVNYRSMGATPAVLVAGLAAGTIVALALTLMVSVRCRRRDLALLMALGFTRRQLGATVAWQSSFGVVASMLLAVPG